MSRGRKGKEVVRAPLAPTTPEKGITINHFMALTDVATFTEIKQSIDKDTIEKNRPIKIEDFAIIIEEKLMASTSINSSKRQITLVPSQPLQIVTYNLKPVQTYKQVFHKPSTEYVTKPYQSIVSLLERGLQQKPIPEIIKWIFPKHCT